MNDWLFEVDTAAAGDFDLSDFGAPHPPLSTPSVVDEDDWLKLIDAGLSSQEDRVSDVYVWGFRPDSGSGSGGGSSGGSGHETDPSYYPDVYGGGEPPSAPDACQIEIRPGENYTPNANTEDAIKKLEEAIKRFDDVMAGIPESLSMRLASEAFVPYYPELEDIALITGAELRDLWSRVDFELLSELTENGQIGQADNNGNDPIFRILDSGVLGYTQSITHEAFYFFHELVHVTAFGERAYDAARALWSDNRDTAEFQDSQWFAANERMVNALAHDLGALFGFDFREVLKDIPYGFSDHRAAIAGVEGPLSPTDDCGCEC